MMIDCTIRKYVQLVFIKIALSLGQEKSMCGSGYPDTLCFYPYPNFLSPNSEVGREYQNKICIKVSQ